MFFLLSKLLSFLLKPLNWLVILAIFSLSTKNRQRRRISIKALIIILLFFSSPLIINQLAWAWETGRCDPAAITNPYDAGILLGGYVNFNADTPPGVMNFHQAGNRLTTTLMLYRTGKIRRILLSGGAGRIIGDVPPESGAVRGFLLQCGVPDSAILVENTSRNTRENALFSKRMTDSLGIGNRCLLITSAWHMRRAEACFRKAGFTCDTFGTDFYTENRHGNWFDWLEPDWKAFMKWDSLIKEWVGWLAYWLKGYI